MSEKEICSICYDTYEKDKIKIVLGCNHSFHFNCLKKWKEEDKDSCPLCRGKMNIELTTQKQEEKGTTITVENKEEKRNSNNAPSRRNTNNAPSRRNTNNAQSLLNNDSIFSLLGTSSRRRRGTQRPRRRILGRPRTRRVRTRGGIVLISSILPF